MTNTIKTRLVEPGTTVVEISGRLHLGNALSQIESSIKKLVADGSRKLVIDVTGLSYIDSAAIGVLLACSGDMDQAGGAIRIAGAQGAVARTFDIVHMSRIVAIDGDVETALRNLSGE
jgi:anti-sigma B factor antagonist